MTPNLYIDAPDDRSLEVRAGERLLLRYVHTPDVPANESPKPYCHPVCTLGGRVLTNLRPNDHPWHHALALTLTHVDDVNFWGGPTWTPQTGYGWVPNLGRQRHGGWLANSAGADGVVLEESVAWEGPDGRILLDEHRRLRVPPVETAGPGGAWTLQWTSRLSNVAGRPLRLSHYHAEGLAGSHYTGLLFRGARDLWGNPADQTTGFVGPGNLRGEAVHGATTPWIALGCSHDGDPVARSTIVFVHRASTGHAWFVRPTLPAVGFCFHFPGARVIEPGETLTLDHALVFADGAVDPEPLAQFAIHTLS